MRKLLVLLLIIFASTYSYGQEVTKEIICKGAAVSVVYTIAPFQKRGMDKTIIKEISVESYKEVIQPSALKAYDLLASGKTKEEVIEILYSDFMKIEDDVVMKGLLKPDPLD
ncbi:hypothetical protein ABW636_05180 [Aquimarina sp. 2201CG1-2-11]|uniref:hypothetical protein n=1 Tax=Aquimarina discodermiae TaxID=3231043 RepID=UPI0034630604